MPPFLDDATLDDSPVVANSAMNRERGIAGPNSYARDLGVDLLAWLRERLAVRETVAWLDLCCGSGRALIEAASRFASEREGRVRIHGVDLVPMFREVPPELRGRLRLEVASLRDWEPEGRYDLITCVHGLHYVGDKLGLIQRAASWLEPDGLFLAHLDPDNLRSAAGAPAGKDVVKALRRSGFAYDPRRRILSLQGGRAVTIPFRYLGANDQAGPNCTGQPAVHSYYVPETDVAVNGGG
jgi:SAM-dependent methyltransferase